MRIRVFCVGKLKEEFYREACAEFMKRLSQKRVDLIEIRDSTPEKEAGEIAKHMKTGFLVVLDPPGVEKTSEEFAEFIKNSECDLAFVIGGPEGVSKELKKQADLMLSLSKMTFPHELARLILLEQIYRAFMINENKTYHR
jgi:23S rRNA (pseudouridine1915-N3)-methyltransferase